MKFLCLFVALLFSIVLRSGLTSGYKNVSENAERIVVDDSSAAQIKNAREFPPCTQVLSNGSAAAGTCCKVDDDVNRPSEVKCLPTFIIAGVQKGGTTALSALMCTLPQVSFSTSKELHFFDFPESSEGGLAAYMRYFRAWNFTDSSLTSSRKESTKKSQETSASGSSLLSLPERQRPQPPLYGESTPFYVASRVSCKLIAESIPGVKMIVLLREPVARFYSEYQMKKRRVASQNEFIALAKKHSVQLLHCLRSHPWRWAAIGSCLPAELASHSHYSKLISAFHMLALSGSTEVSGRVLAKTKSPGAKSKNKTNTNRSNMTSKWTSAVDTCFRDTEEDEVWPRTKPKSTRPAASPLSPVGITKTSAEKGKGEGPAGAGGRQQATGAAAAGGIMVNENEKDGKESSSRKGGRRNGSIPALSALGGDHHHRGLRIVDRAPDEQKKGVEKKVLVSDRGWRKKRMREREGRIRRRIRRIKDESSIITSISTTSRGGGTSTSSDLLDKMPRDRISGSFRNSSRDRNSDKDKIGEVPYAPSRRKRTGNSFGYDVDVILVRSDDSDPSISVRGSDSSRSGGRNGGGGSVRDSSSDKNSSSRSHHSLLFQPIACMGKHANETLVTVREAFIHQLQRFEACRRRATQRDDRRDRERRVTAGERKMAVRKGTTTMEKLRGSTPRITTSKKVNSSTNLGGGRAVSTSEAELSLVMELDLLDGVIDECVGGISMGIETDFYYRSLYAVQLHRCFKSIPREQFLILPTERLQQQPQQTFKQILAFLGIKDTHTPQSQSQSQSKSQSEGAVPIGDTDYTFSSDFIRQTVNKFFPTFEKVSNWRLNSEYDPMPEQLRDEALRFFSPYNSILFELLGEPVYEEWQRKPAREKQQATG